MFYTASVFYGPYSVRMQENTDQKTPNTGTFYEVLPVQKI